MKCKTCEDMGCIGVPSDELIECPVTGRMVGVTILKDCPDCVVGVARGNLVRPARTTRPDEPAPRIDD